MKKRVKSNVIIQDHHHHHSVSLLELVGNMENNSSLQT